MSSMAATGKAATVGVSFCNAEGVELLQLPACHGFPRTPYMPMGGERDG
jgi:hypothetical protein